MDEILLGVFPDQRNITAAIDLLKSEGYDPKNISLVMKDYHKAQEIGDSTGANVSKGAVSGATTGGLVGAAAGLLIGIGAITIPGLGALLIGGPIAAALGLTGAAATTASGALTGALAGGLVGGLVGLGVPEEKAKVYEQQVREGGVLLAVPVADEEESNVRSLLEQYGASDFTTIAAGDFETARSYSTRSTNINPTNRVVDETDQGRQKKGSRTKQRFQSSDKQDYAVVNPVQVQKYLDDVDYPASRDELISAAISQGADENVQYTLRNIQNRRYRSPKEVSEAIGKIK